MIKPIDAKSKLPDGTEIHGIQGIKDYILEFKRNISQNRWLKISSLMPLDVMLVLPMSKKLIIL